VSRKGEGEEEGRRREREGREGSINFKWTLGLL
jgi:hypothetical protein